MKFDLNTVVNTAIGAMFAILLYNVVISPLLTKSGLISNFEEDEEYEEEV